MYAADVVNNQRKMDPKELVKRRYESHHSISDRRVDPMDYRAIMAQEGLFHRDQDYKNIRLTIGDETRYVPFALAHTNTETEIVILPPERMPYDTPWEFVLRHEMEHCINPGASEHYTDLNAANRTRDYMRGNVRLKY